MELSSRGKIIAAANTLFAKQGFDATSVREIADLAGVNVSAINYHFGSKNGLFETLMTEFAQSKVMMALEILETPQTIEEFQLRLRMFATHMLKVAVDEPESSQVVHKHMELFIDIAPEAFKSTFMKLHDSCVNFFKAAQKKKVIRGDLNPDLMGSFFFGSILEPVHQCPISEKIGMPNISDPKYRETFLNTFLELFINGIRSRT